MKKIIAILLCILLCGCFSDKGKKDKDDGDYLYNGEIDLNIINSFIVPINVTNNELSNKNITWLWKVNDIEYCNRHKVEFRINKYTWINNEWYGPQYKIYNNSCGTTGIINLEYDDRYNEIYEFQWKGIVTITYKITLVKD